MSCSPAKFSNFAACWRRFRTGSKITTDTAGSQLLERLSEKVFSICSRSILNIDALSVTDLLVQVKRLAVSGRNRDEDVGGAVGQATERRGLPTVSCMSQRTGSRLQLHPPVPSRHCSSQKLHCGRMHRCQFHRCGCQRRTPQRHRRHRYQARNAGQSNLGDSFHKQHHHEGGGEGVCMQRIVSQQTSPSRCILSIQGGQASKDISATNGASSIIFSPSKAAQLQIWRPVH